MSIFKKIFRVGLSIGASVIGAMVAGPAGAALGSAIAGRVVGFVVSTAISTIGNKMLGSSKSSSTVPKSSLSNSRSRGVFINVNSSVESIPVVYGTVRVGGARAFGPHLTGSDNGDLHMVIVWSEGEISSVDELFFDDVSETDARFDGLYDAHHHTGTDGQIADPDLVSRVSQWTTAHKLSGTAYTYVRLFGDSKAFPRLPNVSAVVSGRIVYDVRDSTWKFSNNPALCIYDYLTNTRFGRGLSAASIDTQSFIDEADYCDDLITLPDDTTQKRYTCDGVIDTTSTVSSSMVELLSSCRGSLVLASGRYKLRLDKPDAANVITLDEDTITGGWTIELGKQSDRYNRIKATYYDKTDKYQPKLAVIDSPELRTEDNGLLLEFGVPLPFTVDVYTAQLLANIELLQSRQQIVVRVTATCDVLKAEPFDVIAIDHATPGWTGKLFRVVRMDLQETGNVGLTLLEYDPSVYTQALTSVGAVADTNLPNPWRVEAPGSPNVVESLYSTREGGGVKSMATITWAAAPYPFVDRYIFEYRPTGASTWTVTAVMSGTTIEVLDLYAGSWDFRVKAVTAIGSESPYATVVQVLQGLLAPPTEPQNMTVSAMGGLAVLRWDLATDLDVRVGGKIVFRHSTAAAAAATWATSASVGDAVPGNHTVTVLPLRAGTYLAKAMDSSGIYSTAPAKAYTKAGTVINFSTLSTVIEDPTFGGTHTDTVTVDSVLKLAGGGLFDSAPDVDALPDWDSYGGVSLSGTFDFAAGIDLGSVKRTRLTKTLAVQVTNPNDDWDARSGTMDTWTDVDGVSGSEADVTVWVRETDDDPAATPTWEAWQRLDTAEFYARGFDFQARLTSTDITYNVEVSTLRVTAEEVV